ncbi:c-type cytochrome [Moraxella marmotae]|uniref:c-type cytochrome n=1 Tax=Moraxella marmotae TaxID=3344520 RepID=UPI0035D443CC
MLNKIIPVGLLSAAIALTGCSQNSTNSSSDNAAPATQQEQRAKLMKDWRHANEGMKAMMENPDTFDAATFKERANVIADSTAQMWQHFEGESAKGGKAEDAIWTNAADFSAKTEEFNAAAAALATAAATATSVSDVEALYGKMASSCGSCHKVYKK